MSFLPTGMKDKLLLAERRQRNLVLGPFLGPQASHTVGNRRQRLAALRALPPTAVPRLAVLRRWRKSAPRLLGC